MQRGLKVTFVPVPKSALYIVSMQRGLKGVKEKV